MFVITLLVLTLFIMKSMRKCCGCFTAAVVALTLFVWKQIGLWPIKDQLSP